MQEQTALRDIFVTGLKNAHAMENQALAIMKPQLSRIEKYPEVAARLKTHISETEGQIGRLENILSSMDEDSSTLKDLALSVGGSVAALGHTLAGDEILKNTFASFAFENYEIAAYRTGRLRSGQAASRTESSRRRRDGAFPGNGIADRDPPLCRSFNGWTGRERLIRPELKQNRPLMGLICVLGLHFILFLQRRSVIPCHGAMASRHRLEIQRRIGREEHGTDHHRLAHHRYDPLHPGRRTSARLLRQWRRAHLYGRSLGHRAGNGLLGLAGRLLSAECPELLSPRGLKKKGRPAQPVPATGNP